MSKKSKLVIAGLGFLGLVALWAGWRHGKTEADGADPAGKTHGETVAAVVKVSRGKLGAPLTLAGAFKPFQDVDVHAKIAGYIKTISVDVGSRVSAGQTLAILEVPELAAQLAGADAAVRRSRQEISRAQGDVERAKSAHVATHAMYERLNQAAQQKAGLVAQQEVDDAQAKDLEGEAQVSSAEAALNAAQQALEVAEANAKQYAALSQYTRIVAPFTGVVTVRYADTGSLIAAGTASSTQSTPVVRIAQISILRLVLPIGIDCGRNSTERCGKSTRAGAELRLRGEGIALCGIARSADPNDGNRNRLSKRGWQASSRNVRAGGCCTARQSGHSDRAAGSGGVGRGRQRRKRSGGERKEHSGRTKSAVGFARKHEG